MQPGRHPGTRGELGSLSLVAASARVATSAPGFAEEKAFNRVDAQARHHDPRNDPVRALPVSEGDRHQVGGTQLTCPDPGPVVPANPWFWTYDDEDAPTQIQLFPSARDQIESDPSGEVNVTCGCNTRVA